ncbi:uncharacterized protein LOC132637465 [Lycium barbarum]|uniref:uncharacterized protein LOC132637465 n=1 Tax=Lycium barbarum TaxID=112863 RepID=UPI00293E8F2F|nr:uncharacterized protein LOC132637465 [Lycium barbarum]
MYLEKGKCPERITINQKKTIRKLANGFFPNKDKPPQNLKKILRKMIDNYKYWHEQLPYALLGYRITTRTSTGATPYLLVYGTEAVIPAEVKILSLRIIQEAELDNAKWICKRYEQLALIDEKRMIAVCHG